jgi:coronin-1B/1C/6
VESGKERLSFDSHPDAIQSFNWNYNGSLYGTYCKDKLIRLVDPRNNAVADTFQGHAGTKAARVCFLGNRNMFCSIGFSKQSERQIFFWDARDTSKALTEVQIDVASGTLLPFFDTDTSMLYLAGKGDTNIRYFEIDDEPPYQYFVANFVGKEPQRGLACVPKRGLETGNCEIMRFLRLTRNGLEPVSFSVPRKGDQFQSDLYPDTFAGRPSLSAAEWFKGGNAQPIMMSLNPKDVGSAIRAVVKDDTTSISPGTVPSVGAGAGPGGGGGGLDAASAARLKQLESKVAALEDENRRLRSGADEAAILKQQVEELKAKNDVLERQIAKMG